MDADGLRNYDMIMASWEADYPDVSGNIEPLFISTNAGKGGANAAAYNNPDVDALINQQSTLTDESARNTLLFQAMDLINADCPYVFLDYPVKQTTLNVSYTGFTMNASWVWNLHFKDCILISLRQRRKFTPAAAPQFHFLRGRQTRFAAPLWRKGDPYASS